MIMRTKKEESKKDPLLEAISEIQNSNQPGNVSLKAERKIVDIVTFCESSLYLDLPSSFNGKGLWMPQKIILKIFYMGTRGNENLKLTQEECEWLYQNKGNEERDGITYEKNISEVIEKLLKKEKASFNFTELHLCVGRRGTKDTIASIISAYEAYKLLTIGNGNPHKFYGIPRGEDIHIINVALSLDQAGTLFGMVRQRIMDGPFFRDRIDHGTTTEIRLFTDEDLRNKSRRKSPLEVKGSVVILCGHSNPDTLRGKSAVLILFDELAFYDEAGKTPGSEFYNALEPSTKKFKKFGDARLVEISSPNTMTGIFYDLFRQAKTSDHILSFQMPTWCINNDIPYESLTDERKRNPENFTREYGAQWGKSGVYGNYFDPGLVDRCIQHGLSPHLRPNPKYNYYIHVDPANGGDRYVAVMVAREVYTNHLGKRRPRAILANIWVWEPVPGVGLMFNEIDLQMVQICGLFHPLCVSYDQWNCLATDEYLYSKKGLVAAKDILLNDEILSKEGSYNKVTSLGYKKGDSGYKIITKFGYSLKANSIHPVYVENKGFVKLCDLKIGDKISLNKETYCFGKVNDSEKALVAGYIVSEGYIGSKGNKIHTIKFTNTNKDVLLDYLVSVTKITGKRPIIQVKHKDHKIYKDASDYSYRDKKSISILMAILGYSDDRYGSYYKTVPDFVMKGDKATVSSFLSSLYEGDGSLSLNPNVLNIEYDTISETLAKQIQLLLLGFGIKSSLKHYTNKFLHGKRFPFYRISLYGENILIFAKEIGFRSEDKKNKITEIVRLQKLDKRPLYNKKYNGLRKEKIRQTNRSRYMFDKVISIEPILLDIVNMEVDGDNTYVSNGIISHNSVHSLQLLRSHGIHTLETSFNRGFKMKIYLNLKELMSYQPTPELWLYDDSRLILEMKALRVRPTQRGQSITTDKHGETKTDDLVDCLAGAASMATDAIRAPLPEPMVVYMPHWR